MAIIILASMSSMETSSSSASSTHPRLPLLCSPSPALNLLLPHSSSARNPLISHHHKSSLLQPMLPIPPDSASSLSSALQGCAANNSLGEGLRIHARLLRLGLLSCHHNNLFHLLFLYSSTGFPEEASAILRLIPPQLLTPFSFNTVLRNLAAAFPDHAVRFFLHMLHTGLRPNEFTFPFILRSSSLLGLFFLGRQLHSLILKFGLFPQNIFCATALLDLYSKLAPLSDAHKLFDRIPNRNEVTWNSMISALGEKELLESGLQVLEMMEDDGFEVSVCSWNSLLAGCVRGGNIPLVLKILGEMAASSSSVTMNAATFNTLLPAIPNILSLKELKALHGFALRRLSIAMATLIDKDRLWSALTAAYSFHRSMDYASRLFEIVNSKTPHLWISVIAGLLKCGRAPEAFAVFSEMAARCVREGQTLSRTLLSLVLPECSPLSKTGLEIHGYAMRKGLESSTSVGNALMAMYCKKGDMESVLRVFGRILEKDVISWNTMAAGYSAAGDFDKAFELFHHMLANEYEPDEYSFSSVLNACGHSSQLCQATTLHARMIKGGFSKSFMVVQNSLMDAYGKCGRVSDAKKVFEEMDSYDIISWNTLISCYGFSDQPQEAFTLFEKMKSLGLKPNRVTFIALLSACSHAGMLKEGLHYFETMSDQYGILPDVAHYACIVDNLGRMGELHRAFEFIKEMPVEPDDYIWSALLSSCRSHGNLELAEAAAMNLIALKPQHSGYWVLLSNIYADASMLDDAANVRAAMKDGGVKKCPGYSWIEVGQSEVHRFLTADKSHQSNLDIYVSLEGLTMQLKDEGYIPRLDSKFSLQRVHQS
ncbi:Pentatricopeptide repeat-containing protein [Platanthera zijinensis]|uniref:Pentatricopeptide repeat-containing protein n=1 Tax=Platanthera zijinensis TaxID=2320716 RepID=A0AAP0BLT5_9ASPA